MQAVHFPTVQQVLSDKLYLAQGIDELPSSDAFRLFRPDETVQYFPLCDDFGPMNLFCVLHFADLLDQKLNEYPHHAIVYCVDNDPQKITNGAFLLGCYMVLRMRLASLKE